MIVLICLEMNVVMNCSYVFYLIVEYLNSNYHGTITRLFLMLKFDIKFVIEINI